jgi:hypothetical protein
LIRPWGTPGRKIGRGSALSAPASLKSRNHLHFEQPENYQWVPFRVCGETFLAASKAKGLINGFTGHVKGACHGRCGILRVLCVASIFFELTGSGVANMIVKKKSWFQALGIQL